MNKNFLTIGLIFLLPVWASAQAYVEDALRYSSIKIEGTARSGGMGNAFGALGSDFTAVGINPAGLGLYRSSEFAFTPNFGMTEIQSSYLNNSMSENNYKLGLSNISYVGSFKSKGGNSSGLVTFNFGIGYNRLKDFNSYSLTEGYKSNSSFLDYISENANAVPQIWSDYYEELASETNVMYYDSVRGVYTHDSRVAGYGESQRKSITRNGSLDEYTLALGLNFNHKLYLGVSLGIDDLYFKESSTLKEWDQQNNIPYLNDFSFKSDLRTYGTGYNFKLGAIFKPINELRLGVSLATPTFFKMNDNFQTSMESSLTFNGSSAETAKATSPLSDYDYNLVTPFRATLSGAFIIAKKGLISADYEYVDYSVAKFRNGGNDEDFVDQNNDINSLYRPVGNFRLGGEYRLTDAFAIRAGYENYPSAYKNTAFGVNQPNAGLNYSIYSAGLGYTSGGFFFDMAYRHSVYSEYALLYPAPQTSTYPTPKLAKFDNTISKVLFTLGFRF